MRVIPFLIDTLSTIYDNEKKKTTKKSKRKNGDRSDISAGCREKGASKS